MIKEMKLRSDAKFFIILSLLASVLWTLFDWLGNHFGHLDEPLNFFCFLALIISMIAAFASTVMAIVFAVRWLLFGLQLNKQFSNFWEWITSDD